MPVTVDARGLACPLPALRARRALAALPPGEPLVVLATDPEAPVDLAALAHDRNCRFDQERIPGGWRFTLVPREGVSEPGPAPS